MITIAGIVILLSIVMLILAPIAAALSGQDAAQFCWGASIVLFAIASAFAIIGGIR